MTMNQAPTPEQARQQDVHPSLSFREGQDEAAMDASVFSETMHDENTTPGDENNNNELKIAKEETQAVRWMRLGLGLTLIGSALAVSLYVFFLAKNSQESNFENAVESSSLKIIESFQAIAWRRLGAIAAFSVTITAQVEATGDRWPSVTIRQFESQAEHVRSLSGATDISFSVMVTDADRQQWENEFVPANLDWQWQESVDFVNNKTTHSAASNNNTSNRMLGGHVMSSSSSGGPPPPGTPDYSMGYSKQIAELGQRGPMISPQRDRYMPWWQKSPPSNNKRHININLATDKTFDGDIVSVLDDRKAAIGTMTVDGYGAEAQGVPSSGFYYPVLDNHNSKVVASLGTLVYWDSFLVGLLPENVNGLVVVVQNTCEQVFSFLINGPTVEYLGEGDLHDPAFDQFKQEASFRDLINEGSAQGSYLGLPLDANGCQYTLAVYPSQELYDSYVNNVPLVLCMSALAIFLFTSLVFIAYDRLVEHRQHLVVTEAQRHGAIVDSLFPEQYKDRLMQANEANNKSTQLSVESSKSAWLNMIMKGGDIENIMTKDKQKEMMDDPIADLYQDCTVFFADIAGFTKWSSSREPCDVFRLLQNIYAVMDKAATRRRVFKVETIGDCYMAVTGLPEPQKDHAVRMAKFASDCMFKVNMATKRLTAQLGADTASLSLRMGLHSGPVTAGILKGDKSRFQLFGDTVNTASRMESTGFKNRIQLSETTANEIIQSGDRDLGVQPREDLVEAKGKGKVQTYWLLPKAPGSMTNTNDSSVIMVSSELNLSSMGSTTDLQNQISSELSQKQEVSSSAANRGISVPGLNVNFQEECEV